MVFMSLVFTPGYSDTHLKIKMYHQRAKLTGNQPIKIMLCQRLTHPDKGRGGALSAEKALIGEAAQG